jgi:hypothetical protein
MLRFILALLLCLPVYGQVAVTYLQATSSASDATSYTFSSQNIGTASSDRDIVVAFHSRLAGSVNPTVTVTVAGESATTHVSIRNAAANTILVGIAKVRVTSGTTGDVVVNFNGVTSSRCGIGMWHVTGAATGAPYDSDSSTASPPSATIDVPDDGVIIAAATNGNAATTTWTNATERYDAQMESVTPYSGADATHASAASVTVTATFTSALQEAFAIISLSPPTASTRRIYVVN